VTVLKDEINSVLEVSMLQTEKELYFVVTCFYYYLKWIFTYEVTHSEIAIRNVHTVRIK